jgi:putative DNA primase/helicase
MLNPEKDDNTIIPQILSEKHYQELTNSGLNFKNIIDTDCFTVTDKRTAKRLTGYSLPGLVIPYFDPKGLPYTTAKGSPFYRIKPDWSFVDNPQEMPKYLSPKGEGNRPYFAPTYTQWEKALRFRKIPIHITEGEKKAAKLGACGYAAIGLTGVHGFMDRAVRNENADDTMPYLVEDNEARGGIQEQLEKSRPLPELELIGDANIWEYRTVYISFDSDIMQKWQVKNALKNLATWLHEKGADVYIVLIPNEINGDKNGVDDFIVRHGLEAYEKVLQAAEPAFNRDKGKPFFYLPKEPGLAQKASLLWCVLKEHWRYRPSVGWYNWMGNSWELSKGNEGSYVDNDIFRFVAANGWKVQSGGLMADLLRHMRAKTLTDTWDTKSKVAFKNGVLDIESNQFSEGHRREDFMTVLLPYCYDQNAECPNWLKFLGEALKDDPKAIALVQAFFRWALLPKADGKLDLEIGWDLYGVGGTGKGTVLETLTNIIGKHNCGHFSSKSISNPNVLAGLLDKRVSISPDDNGHMEDFGLYGSIVSNERVPIKMLYRNIFPTTLNTFMVRAYNNFITTPSGAKGLDRRIVVMSLNAQPKTINTDLQGQINAELSGVFNWAWSVSNAEMKRRILWAGEVEAVVEATTEMFRANNQTFVFLQENYPEGAEDVRIRNLHYQYSVWSKGRGDNPLGERKFAQSIQTFGCQQGDKTEGYFPYYIPPFDKVDILQKFGILRGKTKNTEIDPTPEMKEKEGLGNIQDFPGFSNLDKSLNNNPDEQQVSEINREPGDLGIIDDSKASSFGNSTKTDTTDIDTNAKSNIVEPPTRTPLKIVPTSSPNPKGVITYHVYILGKIGNVMLNFDKQGLAKEWLKTIELVFNYRGILSKLKNPIGRYKWQILYYDFDRDALERLEAKDLSQSPHNQ